MRTTQKKHGGHLGYSSKGQNGEELLCILPRPSRNFIHSPHLVTVIWPTAVRSMARLTLWLRKLKNRKTKQHIQVYPVNPNLSPGLSIRHAVLCRCGMQSRCGKET
jgi:hypothetical protein